MGLRIGVPEREAENLRWKFEKKNERKKSKLEKKNTSKERTSQRSASSTARLASLFPSRYKLKSDIVMRLAARVARSCCALQQRRGGANANAAPAATAAFAATALTFSQPLPRARSHHPSLRRLDAVLKRPLATSCRSESVQSNNRGGTAESSSSSDPSAASDDDGTAKPRPRPLPQKRQRRMRLDEAASLAAGDGVSRTVIQSWIARGKVFVDGAPVTKAGHPVSPKAVVEVRASEERFVCRGGLKLDAALGEFGIDVRGARAIDCGLSTGGFADRLLQGGAEAVLGVDVGYGAMVSVFFFLFFSRLSLSLSLSLSLFLDLRSRPIEARDVLVLLPASRPAPYFHFLTNPPASSSFKKQK